MPPAGLEPATLWLEATRAVRLRHEGSVKIAINYKTFCFDLLHT